MEGKCITARLEIMPNVLSLMKEYKRLHPTANDQDAYGAAYTAFHAEMTMQTLVMKARIGLDLGL